MIRHPAGPFWTIAVPFSVVGAVFGAALFVGFRPPGALIVSFVAGLPLVAWSQHRRHAARMAVPIRVFDMRRGDDRSTTAADAPRLLAGVPEPVVMVDALNIDWQPHAARLDQVLRTDSAHPFVICNAWWPGNRTTEAAVAAAFPGAGEVGPAFLATREPGQPFVADALAVRACRGGWSSGTWIIGTCWSPEALADALRAYPTSMDPVRFAALDVFSAVNGALCIDEPIAGSTLIARVSADNEAAVDALLRELKP